MKHIKKRHNLGICGIFRIIVVLVVMSLSVSGQELEIIYPPPESEGDTRDNDVVELLHMILQKTVPTYGPFTMRPDVPMNEARYTEFLKKGKRLNIIWTSVTKSLETELRPIRIPIRKGILGYRIFLIRKQDQVKFAHITTLDDLKGLVVGQGHFWNDVKVFEANGFQVEKSGQYELLFKMLHAGRFDFFSRGMVEAFVEYEERKDTFPNLHVEETLLLYYPWPKFFYVSHTNPQLVGRIQRGFEMVLQDGSYDTWFEKYNRAAIERANLTGRRLFKLENPLLPPTVPLDKPKLWYDPFQEQ